MQLSISESVSLETWSTTSTIIKYWQVIGKTFSQNSFKIRYFLLKPEVQNGSPNCFKVTLFYMTRLILTQSTSTDTGGIKYVESTATMKKVTHLDYIQHLL